MCDSTLSVTSLVSSESVPSVPSCPFRRRHFHHCRRRGRHRRRRRRRRRRRDERPELEKWGEGEFGPPVVGVVGVVIRLGFGIKTCVRKERTIISYTNVVDVNTRLTDAPELYFFFF